MIKLYSDGHHPDSHRTRIVLAEKELPVTTIEVDPENPPAELLDLNPYGTLPTIVDRDIVFFETSVINEYLDERYPYPPLKPGSPADRAKMRIAVLQIEREVYSLYEQMQQPRKKKEAAAKLTSYLESLNTYMASQEYFIGEQYTLADISLAPIFWRLPSLGIDTSKLPHLEAYMDRLFSRPAFRRSLSEHEEMLRD